MVDKKKREDKLNVGGQPTKKRMIAASRIGAPVALMYLTKKRSPFPHKKKNTLFQPQQERGRVKWKQQVSRRPSVKDTAAIRGFAQRRDRQIWALVTSAYSASPVCRLEGALLTVRRGGCDGHLGWDVARPIDAKREEGSWKKKKKMLTCRGKKRHRDGCGRRRR